MNPSRLHMAPDVFSFRALGKVFPPLFFVLTSLVITACGVQPPFAAPVDPSQEALETLPATSTLTPESPTPYPPTRTPAPLATAGSAKTAT